MSGFLILGVTLMSQQSLACTGGALTAKDGGVFVWRTLECGTSLNS